jgi:tetratricopeptide (TPR) repeat protein
MSTQVAASFAVTAEAMLAEHRYAEAVQLCAAGVTEFPQYLGGYLMLARAYEAMGKVHDASVMRTAAQERFPWYVAVQKPSQPVQHAEVAAAAEPEVVAQVVAEAVAEVVAAVVPEVVSAEPEAEVEPQPREQPSVLRMIDTAHLVNDERIIRSASVRLIPGLEYTSLRFENLRSRGRRDIAYLSDPPPFRSFHTMRRTTRPAEPSREQRREPGKAVSLEEIAARLERRARMPRASDAVEQVPPPEPNGPMLMTETIARIYMQQGSYDKAIEAFRMLQKSKPEKHAQFDALIAECERARTS